MPLDPHSTAYVALSLGCRALFIFAGLFAVWAIIKTVRDTL